MESPKTDDAGRGLGLGRRFGRRGRGVGVGHGLDGRVGRSG